MVISDIEPGDILQVGEGEYYEILWKDSNYVHRLTLTLTASQSLDSTELPAIQPGSSTITLIESIDFNGDIKFYFKHATKEIGPQFDVKTEGYLEHDDVPWIGELWIEPGTGNAPSYKAVENTGTAQTVVVKFRGDVFSLSKKLKAPPPEGKRIVVVRPT